jgi:amidase
VPIDRDVSTPRVGFCRTPIWDEAEPDTKALLEKVAAKLGAKDVAFAPQFEDILDDHAAITGWESSRNYADERLRNPDKVSAELMAILKKSDGITLDRYVAAQRKTVAFKAFIDSLFDSFDVLICPVARGEAPKGQAFTGDPRFQSIWTLAGTPCVTLPLGTGGQGLPLGVQLVGLRHADDRLLSISQWVLSHA